MIKEAIQFFHVYRDWIGEGLKPVPPEQSEYRANVCMNCPKRIETPSLSALKGIAVGFVAQTISLKNRMRLTVPEENKLGICDACKCVLKLKVHVPIKTVINNTPLEKLDPNCWILKEKADLE